MRNLVYSILLIGIVACSHKKEDQTMSINNLIPVVFQSKPEPRQLSHSEYMSYVENEENGLKVKKEVEDMEYTLQLKPTDYVTLFELKSKAKDEKLFNETKKEFEGLQYYTLRIQSKKFSNLLNFDGQRDDGSKLDYLAFKMQDDLKLVDGTDTLSCMIYHFERTYNITPYCDFLIAFEKSKGKGITDKTLIFDEKLFNSGIIKFKIRKEDIENIPSLIFYKNESES